MKKGFIVRSLADKSVVSAKTGDATVLDAALASGAQLIATDFPAPVPSAPMAHVTNILDGTPSRCDPVTAPAECTPSAIESPALLQP